MAKDGKLGRILRVLWHLQTTGSVETGALQSAVGVSRRTLYRYIRDLREADVPIYYNERLQRYFIQKSRDKFYGRITPYEIGAMLSLVESFSYVNQREGLFSQAVRGVLALVHACSDSDRETIMRVRQTILVKQKSEMLNEWNLIAFERIHQSCVGLLSIRIEYGNPNKCTLFSPYCLCHLDGRWSAIGRSSLDRGIVKIRIADITQAYPTGNPFQVPPRFDAKKHTNLVDDSELANAG